MSRRLTTADQILLALVASWEAQERPESPQEALDAYEAANHYTQHLRRRHNLPGGQ